LKDSIGELKVNFPSNTIFCTLGNSNYVGSYFAMLLPILLIFFIYVKKIRYKLILAVPLCLVVFNWIGCGSRAGMVGGGISIILILIMFRKKLFTHKIISISTVFLLCISIFVINYCTGGSFLNRIERMISLEGKDTSIEIINSFDKQFGGLKDIKMDSEKTSIVTDKGTMLISIINGQLSAKDQNNRGLEISQNNDTAFITDDRFENIKLNTKRDAGLIEVYYNDIKLINIILTDNGLRSDTNIWLISRGNKEIESFGFKGKESFGSNRGYIWDRTLPLLKDTIILGHGPDTFPLYFPQYDFIGKLRMYQTAGIFVDKPHNIYLQTAVNTGIVSLLALLAVFGVYFISSIKIYFKQNFNNFLPIAGMACFTAFCGYAVAGMFNDSVVAVAPVFWILLGLGIGINIKIYRLKLDIKEK
jgi:O-antigen ligase